MKTIKLNKSNFIKRASIPKKSKKTYSALVKQYNATEKLESCTLSLDTSLYLHINSK